MTKEARISVAMATFNGARFLQDQLDSLAAQRHLPFELHVGDDGSEDETLAILDRFGASAPFPVHVRRNPERLGVKLNFLRTAHRCSGTWIAFCDQDDVWLPQKLLRCTEAIARGGQDLGLIAHNAMAVTETLEPIKLKTFWSGVSIHPRLSLPPHWLCAGFSQIFHRRLVQQIPFECDFGELETQTWNTHDEWIPLVANATGSIVLLGEPLALYRRHDANVSTWQGETPTIRNKFARTMRDNSATHLNDAEMSRALAQKLHILQGQVSDRRVASLIGDAAVRTAAYGRHLDRRAAVYRETGFGRRLTTLAKLCVSGAYAPFRVCSFGLRGLVKDLAYSLLPARRSE